MSSSWTGARYLQVGTGAFGVEVLEILAAIVAIWVLGLLSLAVSLPPEFWQADPDNRATGRLGQTAGHATLEAKGAINE